MKTIVLKGCGTALATPFREGKVDYAAYRKLVERQLAAGIHFLVPLGSTAETPCLEDDERCELLKIARELCPDRPIVAGVGTNSLAATLRNIRMLEPYGPDAYLVVVPYYNKPTQDGMYEYFKAVAASTAKGIVMYNVPGRTGSNLHAATAVRAARDIPNVIAVKEASGDLNQIQEIIRNAPEGFSVLSGNDDQTWPLMACGGDGVISVASNLAPGLVVEMVEAAQSEEMSRARDLNARLMPLFRDCFVESNPIPLKAGLAALGLCTPDMRSPLTTATAATMEIMKNTLSRL